MREWRGLPILRTPSDAPVQLVTGPESKPGNDFAANIDVVFARDVARRSATYKSRAAGENFQHTQPLVVGHVTTIERVIREKPKTENLAPTGTRGGDQGFRELLRFYTLHRMSPRDKGGEKFSFGETYDA